MKLRSLSIVTALLVASFVLAQTKDMVAASAAEAKPLGVGSAVPAAKLRNVDGKTVTLKDALGGKPTVLIFYRGGWCPFCNRHLSDLATIEPDLLKMGYQLLAISPDSPEELRKMSDKDHLTYKLFSDSKADALKAFGVAFKLDDETFNKYRDQYHIDIEKSSGGQTHHILPVPSVFIVDTKGVIRFVHSNPDYKVRMKGSEVLEAAKTAMDSGQ